MTLRAADVMGFAGSMAAGVDQAGFDIVAKREPSAFNGFGVRSFAYNLPWVESQVAPWGEWDLPAEPVELVFGCPPCTGFSQLSFANTLIHGNIVGPDAPINECMAHLIDYAARVKPQVVIMESVGVAFKSGREWMESLWERLNARSGLNYMLTHVNMNASMVGGDVIRPRYFLVAHRQAFGVGLEFVTPRTSAELLADLPGEEDEVDNDWGHRTKISRSSRWLKTFEFLKEHGRTWKPGTRLPDNNIGLEPPSFWIREDGRHTERSLKAMGEDGPAVYSHWFSTDPFSTYRWRPDKPYGVVVAAVLDRAIHPVHDRNLTYREAARFMSLPDDWSLRALVESNSGAELGKAVPTASAKWIAHWARMSIEGTPGEYAGRDTADPDIRVITVNSPARVGEILKGNPDDAWWTGSDPDPKLWLVDRKQRPTEWWQREDELGLFAARAKTIQPARSAPTPVTPEPAKTTRRAAPVQSGTGIVCIQPEVVAVLLESLSLTKAEAAAKLGVSVSRINELTTHTRPKSWLNAERWEDVQVVLRG